jgi:site-specific recombinase XerD
MTNEQVLQKMEEDFLLRGSSEKTRQTYRTALFRFSAYAGKERYSDLDEKDLRSFLLHLHKEGKLQGTSINTYNAGCKFFLEVVLNLCHQPQAGTQCACAPQVAGPFQGGAARAVLCPSQRNQAFAFFLTLYGTGMRTFELTKLKVTDIETDKTSGLRFLRSPQGKRNKERRVILPDACYQALRHYWREYRPETQRTDVPGRKNNRLLDVQCFHP